MAAMTNTPVWLTGDAEADRLLTEDDNALLIGMILDQQVPMEKAFSGPLVIAQRMGGKLDVAAIAAMPEEDFAALCSRPPAIHRFPAAMAKRVRQVCQVLTDEYEADAGNVWQEAPSGAAVKQALMALPGFGAEKAAIFTAVLGKHRGVQPPGWREAAAGFGEEGSFRSGPTSWTANRWPRCERPSVPSRRPRRRADRRSDESLISTARRDVPPWAMDLGEVRHSRGYQQLVKVGLVSYGVVHLLVAWIALNLAFGKRGEASPNGALREVAKQPLGEILLWIMAVGLFALTVWQLIEATVGRDDPDREGNVKGRARSAGRAAVYLALGQSGGRRPVRLNPAKVRRR